MYTTETKQIMTLDRWKETDYYNSSNRIVEWVAPYIDGFISQPSIKIDGCWVTAMNRKFNLTGEKDFQRLITQLEQEREENGNIYLLSLNYQPGSWTTSVITDEDFVTKRDLEEPEFNLPYLIVRYVIDEF